MDILKTQVHVNDFYECNKHEINDIQNVLFLGRPQLPLKVPASQNLLETTFQSVDQNFNNSNMGIIDKNTDIPVRALEFQLKKLNIKFKIIFSIII